MFTGPTERNIYETISIDANNAMCVWLAVRILRIYYVTHINWEVCNVKTKINVILKEIISLNFITD